MLKKSIVGLTFILVLLLVVSSVNASNNDTDDIVSVETDETVSIEESSYDSDEFASTVEMLEDGSDEALSSVKDDEISSFEENDNVLGVNLPPYTAYNVKIDHVENNNGDHIVYTLVSDVSHGYDEDYAFHLKVYDSNNTERCSLAYYGDYSDPKLIGKTIPASWLKQGVYTIKLVNYVDNHVMDSAELAIGPIYEANKYRNVNINAPNAYYNQNKKITYSFEGNFKGSFNIYKDNALKYSAKLDTGGYIDGIFKYNKHSYSYAINNLKEIGKYAVKIIDSNGKIIAQSTFEITKAPTISVSQDFSTKKGSKETIYLFVYDNDWNGKGISGTVKFNIGGKTYTANVKNGLAQIKIKFPSKVKTYKCSAQFLGNNHYKASSEKFTIHVTKDSTDVYVDSFTAKPEKKHTIKAYVHGSYDGKKIKKGTVKFKINGKTYKAKIKNGIAKLTIKTPNKAKTYNCKATHIGNKKIKGGFAKFTITVKKTANVKQKKLFNVIVPADFNQYTSKTIGKYKIKLYKYATNQRCEIHLNLYKNGKKIKSSSSIYKTKVWLHLNTGSWKYWKVNNYGKETDKQKLTYNQYLNVDKVKVEVWAKS